MSKKQQNLFDCMASFSALQAAALQAARGKHTHRVIARYESFCRRFRFVLRCDLDRFHSRLRDLRDRLRQRSISGEEVKQRVNAWIAHANHVNAW